VGRFAQSTEHHHVAIGDEIGCSSEDEIGKSLPEIRQECPRRYWANPSRTQRVAAKDAGCRGLVDDGGVVVLTPKAREPSIDNRPTVLFLARRGCVPAACRRPDSRPLPRFALTTPSAPSQPLRFGLPTDSRISVEHKRDWDQARQPLFNFRLKDDRIHGAVPLSSQAPVSHFGVVFTLRSLRLNR
jgi:hypothetical protein